jgi:arylsulfatase
VIDVAPTVLDAAGLREPTFVNGVQQKPYEGVSMTYAFDDAKAAERHQTQYFEMFCNRGIYHEGWTAVTRHVTPWLLSETKPLDEDVWELYDTTSDWTQAHDLAHEHPEKLAELQRLFLIEAAKYNVLPLDDRRMERFIPELAGRPTLIQGDRQLLYGGMGRLSESSVVSIKNKSHAVTAELNVPDGGAEGVIIAQGGSIGGWSLYLKEGKPRYCYNLLGIERFYVGSDTEVPSGTHQVRAEFDYDGPGLGKGGTVTLYLDGNKIGEGTVAGTAPAVFSADDTCDVGVENGALVADDYPVPNAFTGEVNWVEIDVGMAAADADHLIDPDELLRVAMARQ